MRVREFLGFVERVLVSKGEFWEHFWQIKRVNAFWVLLFPSFPQQRNVGAMNNSFHLDRPSLFFGDFRANELQTEKTGTWLLSSCCGGFLRPTALECRRETLAAGCACFQRSSPVIDGDNFSLSIITISDVFVNSIRARGWLGSIICGDKVLNNFGKKNSQKN